MTTQLSAYQQYLSDAYHHADPAIKAAYGMIPMEFLRQAFTQGKVKNYLDCNLVSKSAYDNMSLQDTDYFRVELVDGDISAETGFPSFKLRLVGKIDINTKEMVPMSKGALPNPQQPWLTNFRSTPVVITPADVQAGKITEADYAEILKYCQTWKSVGQSAMYQGENKNNRLSFVARNEAFLFSFNIQFRPNTSKDRKAGTPLWTPGITNVSWSNVHLFRRTSGTVAQGLQIADEVGTVAPAPIVQGHSFEPAAVGAQMVPGAGATAIPNGSPFATNQVGSLG